MYEPFCGEKKAQVKIHIHVVCRKAQYNACVMEIVPLNSQKMQVVFPRGPRLRISITGRWFLYCFFDITWNGAIVGCFIFTTILMYILYS